MPNNDNDVIYFNSQPNGQDGLGFPKTVYGEGVRIYARDLLTTKNTSIRVTGMSSGATFNINVIVSKFAYFLVSYCSFKSLVVSWNINRRMFTIFPFSNSQLNGTRYLLC